MTEATPEHGRHRREERIEPRGRGWPLLITVVALLCVAVAVLDALLLLRVRDQRATDHARSEAAGAARNAVSEILSYDYRTLERDIAAAKKDATGQFLAEYSTNAPRLLTNARRLKAVVQASVGSVSVVSASKSRVVVLSFVDQLTVKAGDRQTRIDQNRVRMTMVKVHGHWLVAALDAL